MMTSLYHQPEPKYVLKKKGNVSSLPRNTTLYPLLPNLKLFQSSIYLFENLPRQVKPDISFYYPDFKNASSIENGVDPMAEWATVAVLEWQYKLAEKEAIFRKCAYSDTAPLDCPVFSSLVSH